MYSKFKYQNNRFIPFAGPFLLGALTGGVAVNAFNKPVYNYPMYYPTYPYYYSKSKISLTLNQPYIFLIVLN